MPRPTEALVELGACVANAQALRAVCGVPLFYVVKADAYGHGAVAVAHALVTDAADARFAVSLVEEGVELRDGGVSGQILVMGPTTPGDHAALVAHTLTPLCSTEGDLRELAALGRNRRRPVDVHLKLDTGMGRLGFLDGIPSWLDTEDGVRVVGVATHFACADTDDPSDAQCMTARQLRAFRDLVNEAQTRFGSVEVHAANSAGLLRFLDSHFDACRPGLALYGAMTDHRLRPALTLRTEILQLRDVPAGATVSYGATWQATRDSRLAVLHIGYADGLPRRASNQAQALIAGRRVSLVGTISMDMVLADVTDLAGIEVGDEAVLLGAQGKERITVSEVAQWAGLIEYEVTCGLSRRVPRRYV